MKNDKLEKKGGLWCLTRLLISIPLAAGVIAVATVPFDWGLDRTMLGRPIIYVPVGLADVVVFLECILFACCASRGTFFKNQGKVYLFYSLTLGFPFGTATKILWLLHAGGNAEIPTSYIPIPCIAGMAIATIVIFARLILACVCSETCRCREWNKTRLCCMSVLIIIAVAVFWLITFSLIHHTGVYEKDVKFHIDVWLICLLPVWSVAAVAFVYVTYRFWLLIVQSKHTMHRNSACSVFAIILSVYSLRFKIISSESAVSPQTATSVHDSRHVCSVWISCRCARACV